MSTKKRWYDILEADTPTSRLARPVRWGITALILVNVLALVVESHFPNDHAARGWFFVFEAISVAIFTMEYLLRLWVCTDNPAYAGPRGRLRWARSPFAAIDIVAILPFFLPWLGVDLRAFRALRLFRLARALKLGRYSRSVRLLGAVLNRRRSDLLATTSVMMTLLLVAASLLYFAEHDAQPHKFSSITASMWWAVETLTTVGYGDVIPITIPGRVLAGMIAVLGVGLFGLPAAVIASGYVDELRTRCTTHAARCPHCDRLLSDPPTEM